MPPVEAEQLVLQAFTQQILAAGILQKIFQRFSDFCMSAKEQDHCILSSSFFHRPFFGLDTTHVVRHSSTSSSTFICSPLPHWQPFPHCPDICHQKLCCAMACSPRRPFLHATPCACARWLLGSGSPCLSSANEAAAQSEVVLSPGKRKRHCTAKRKKWIIQSAPF